MLCTKHKSVKQPAGPKKATTERKIAAKILASGLGCSREKRLLLAGSIYTRSLITMFRFQRQSSNSSGVDFSGENFCYRPTPDIFDVLKMARTRVVSVEVQGN